MLMPLATQCLAADRPGLINNPSDQGCVNPLI